MATETIEILPKTSLIVAMTQSPEQAIDIGQYKTGLLQAWVDVVAAGDKVQLDVQQSNVNEDSAFEDIGGMTLTVTQSFAGPGGRLSLAVQGRYIRLKITPLYPGPPPITSINVRAVLHLNRD